jgi:hypothetical protein
MSAHSLRLQDEEAVIDGFSYSLSNIYTPGWYRPMALGQLEALRKAGNYRSRWYTVPEDLDEVLPGFGVIEQQLRIVPGTYLYGYMVESISLGNGVLVRITEGATGIALMEDFVYAANLTVPSPPGGSFSFGQPTLMTQPRLIIDPGWVNVEIANPGVPDPVFAFAHIVLLCAEPCTTIEQMGSSECAL